MVRDVHNMATMIAKKVVFYDRKRLFYDFVMDLLFIVAIITKVKSFEHLLALYFLQNLM